MTPWRPLAWAWALAFVLLLVLRPAAGATTNRTKLSVAFVYLTTTKDLGWTWRHNQGRIFLHGALTEKYPDLDVQTNYVDDVPEVNPPNCPPIWDQLGAEGKDIVFGTSFGFQFCMVEMVGKYPNTVWFAVSGFLSPAVPNWGLGYARIYQPTYLAGIVAGRATKTGKVGAVMPIKIPETQRQLAAFALGVASVNASIEVHVGWTGDWLSPSHETWTTQRLGDLGLDVLFHRTDGIQGVLASNAMGIYSIGFNADHRMLAGENVLISPYFNWGVLYQEVAELVLQNQYAAATPINLFPGIREEAVALSNPSFYVPKHTMELVADRQAAMKNGSTDVFCGAMVTNTWETVGYPNVCQPAANLTSMMWQLFNTRDHGHYMLPTEACSPGELPVWHKDTQTFTCPPCPAGTYAQVQMDGYLANVTCASCAAGLYAPANATDCRSCAPGSEPGPAQDHCVPCQAGAFSEAGVLCVACAIGLESAVGADRCMEPAPSEAPIIIAVVVVVLLLLGVAVVGLAVLYWRRTRERKVMAAAPVGEVVLMFTDVQSSTLLWDKHPTDMAVALDLHNNLIREKLRQHGGYEVKTIGDAFMVVFSDSDGAMHCAMRIQEDLTTAEWPKGMAQEAVCKMEFADHGPLLWNGLRVRIGLHVGSPEPMVNWSMWRVDYFGPHVNLAARVESKSSGGQTLITSMLYAKLSHGVRKKYAFASVGPQHFRGMAQPVECFSVLPVALSSRVFPDVKDNVCTWCQSPLLCHRCDADDEILGPVLAQPRGPWGARGEVGSLPRSRRSSAPTLMMDMDEGEGDGDQGVMVAVAPGAQGGS